MILPPVPDTGGSFLLNEDVIMKKIEIFTDNDAQEINRDESLEYYTEMLKGMCDRLAEGETVTFSCSFDCVTDIYDFVLTAENLMESEADFKALKEYAAKYEMKMLKGNLKNVDVIEPKLRKRFPTDETGNHRQ